MPRAVRAFACEFGCGRSVITSKRRMADHEQRCNWNPANCACITCEHFIPGDNPRCHEIDMPPEPAGCGKGHDIQNKLCNQCPDWRAKS